MGCVEARPPDLGEGECYIVLEYRQTANLVIKQRDALGRVVRGLQVRLRLSSPVTLETFTAVLGRTAIAGSCCALPGQFPTSAEAWGCQDRVKTEISEDSLLVCLCDGHGPEGGKVAEYCQHYAAEYYRSHIFEFQHDPSMNFTILCEVCHNKLKEHKEINIERSGASLVLLYMNEKGFCVGNVGDSRAVLAYLPKEILPLPPPKHSNNPYRREITPNKVLGATQLTIDQRPDNKEELKRITKAGGVVEKAKDSRGVRAGEYRLWKAGCTYPGLALSRAIGDTIGEDCGLIPTPIVQSYRAHLTDQFLILGSSGLWAVLENREAVDFVERYRQGAQHRSDLGKGFPKSSNTTIAHLLCEEARLRWLGEAEEGANLIDLTCVVVEMNSEQPIVERMAPESPREAPVIAFDREEEKETEEFNVEDLKAGLTPLRDLTGAFQSESPKHSLN